jgi:hypothetical protein
MTTARDPRSLTAVQSAPAEGAPAVNHPMADGPGLFEAVGHDGNRFVTNIRRLAGDRRRPGSVLILTAMALLGILDAGLFAVSFAAQNQYILHAKHQAWPAVIEATALDAGMVIFSLLALGLARGGQSARVERALIMVCAFGSAAMNYAAADVSSLRSVAAYVMPPVFLAIVTDRVIAVVRRHVLGMEAERSAWAVLGRAALAAARMAGKTVLYGLRLLLAPRSTLSGARSLVLLTTPLPGAPAVARALDPVRAALDDALGDLRDRHEMTAAKLEGNIRAAEQAFRTQTDAVRETLRTETSAVRETLRTEIEAVREAARTQAPVPARDEAPEAGRDALVTELAGQIRDAIRSGDRWTPDYGELMARTGYRRRWCEKAVQDAKTQVLTAPGPDGPPAESTATARHSSPGTPDRSRETAIEDELGAQFEQEAGS